MLVCARVEGGATEGAEDAASLALLMPLINLAFFGLVGASVKLVRTSRLPKHPQAPSHF